MKCRFALDRRFAATALLPLLHCRFLLAFPHAHSPAACPPSLAALAASALPMSLPRRRSGDRNRKPSPTRSATRHSRAASRGPAKLPAARKCPACSSRTIGPATGRSRASGPSNSPSSATSPSRWTCTARASTPRTPTRRQTRRGVLQGSVPVPHPRAGRAGGIAQAARRGPRAHRGHRLLLRRRDACSNSPAPART